MNNFKIKEKYNIEDLINVMAMLRSEDGCPWDRKQTHKSIRKNFIEETYEAIEAIDNDDKKLLKEELGDVLLQVVFHCQMEAEEGTFDFSDVADAITKKLVERHPHIFGNKKADNAEDVHEIWEEVKLKTKHQKKGGEQMLAIPKQFPALMRANKIQSKAKNVGFSYATVQEAIEDLKNEIAELEYAIKNCDEENMQEEIGDVLFAASNVSRLLENDAEEALSKTNDKFINRFLIMEEIIKEKGSSLEETAIPELLELWEEAKMREHKN